MSASSPRAAAAALASAKPCRAPAVRPAEAGSSADASGTCGSQRPCDTIFIDGLEVFAKHGVYPEENALGQKFLVSLALYVDTRPAGEKDDLACSVNYGEVAQFVDAYLRAHTFKLIEAVAEHLAAALLDAYPLVAGLRVRIDKPWAPVGLPLRSVGVKIERWRASA